MRLFYLTILTLILSTNIASAQISNPKMPKYEALERLRDASKEIEDKIFDLLFDEFARGTTGAISMTDNYEEDIVKSQTDIDEAKTAINKILDREREAIQVVAYPDYTLTAAEAAQYEISAVANENRDYLFSALNDLHHARVMILLTQKRKDAANSSGNIQERDRLKALVKEQEKAYNSAFTLYAVAGLFTAGSSEKAKNIADRMNKMKNSVAADFYDVLMGTDVAATNFLEGIESHDDKRSAAEFLALAMYTSDRDNEYNDATDLFNRFIMQETVGRDGIRIFRLTTDGEFARNGEMTLFINYKTRQVLGYGTAAFTETLDGTSLLNYAEGVYVGELSADQKSISGRFLGMSGGNSLANDYQINSGGRIPDDITGMTFTSLPLGAYTDGGSGNITAEIYVGDPLNTANNTTRTLTYNVQETGYEPYKLANGYNVEADTTRGSVTYEGYGRISKQNRKTAAPLASEVMDDLGDLTVTVDNTQGAESIDYSFNGSDPQSTSSDAVISQRLAGSISQLADNMLRSGVMFPLEGYDNTNLVHFVDFSDGLYNGSSDDIGYGFGVVGTPTPLADMPAGSATYSGGVAGYTSYQFPPGTISSSEQFYGNTTLNVDFDTTAVTGSMALFNHNDNTALNNFTMTGNVAGNGLNLTSITDGGTATGSGTGTFYGSAAQEVGGQFVVNDNPNDTMYEGVFWGKQ